MQVRYCLAMVICDAIRRDPATGKFTLLGTLSVVGAAEFPSQHILLAVYMPLTDGCTLTGSGHF